MMSLLEELRAASYDANRINLRYSWIDVVDRKLRVAAKGNWCFTLSLFPDLVSRQFEKWWQSLSEEEKALPENLEPVRKHATHLAAKWNSSRTVPVQVVDKPGFIGLCWNWSGL